MVGLLGVMLGCMNEKLRLKVSAGASARLWVFSRTGAVACQYNCGQRKCCCEPALRWCLDTAQPSAKLQIDAFDQMLGDGGSSRACNGPPCDTSRPRTSQRSPQYSPYTTRASPCHAGRVFTNVTPLGNNGSDGQNGVGIF